MTVASARRWAGHPIRRRLRRCPEKISPPCTVIERRKRRALPDTSERPFKLRRSYVLGLVGLVILLLASAAIIGKRLAPTGHEFVGFPANAPRQDGFVTAGKLTHDVTEVVHGGNGIHVRLTVRIHLNHDRVFLHSIESCLSSIRYMSYSLYDSLSVDDPTFVERFVKDHLSSFNGTSAVDSVELIDYEFDPEDSIDSGGANVNAGQGDSSGIDEPSDLLQDKTDL